MAIIIRIPEGAVTGLLKLYRFSPEDRARILEVTRTVGPSLGIRAYGAEFGRALGFDADVALEIAQVLAGLISLADRVDIDEALIGKRAVEAVLSSPNLQEEEASPEKVESFQTFLSEFIHDSGSLGLSSKALRLMTSHQNVFIDAHIFSDVRPIFGSGPPEDGAKYAVLFHDLEIRYAHDEMHETMHFALDIDDLLTLKKNIDRALSKHKVLSDLVLQQNLRVLDPKPD